MKKISSLSVICVLLAGCATGPATYEKAVSDHRVEDDLYEVAARGNPETTAQRVNLLWLYRCAELARQHGKTYVSLNDVAGKEIVKPYTPKAPPPGFGAQTGWDTQVVPFSDGVFRPGDRVDFVDTGHTTVIHTTTVGGGPAVFSHDGLARFFDDPLPVEAGVAFRAQLLLDELKDYVHGDPKMAAPAIPGVLAPARIVTPLGRDYAAAQLRLRAAATRTTPNAPATTIGVALLHANIAFPDAGSWLPAGTGFVSEGSIVKSDGKSVTFIAALPDVEKSYRFERLHIDCGRGIGGVVLSMGGPEMSDVTSAQLAAIVDVEVTMSSLDQVHRGLVDEACSAAGYRLAV